MSLVGEVKAIKGILLTNLEVQFYRLSSVSGQIINVRATHTVRADGRLIFMQRLYTECFFEIPEQSVAQVERLSEVDEAMMAPLRFNVGETLGKYFLKLPDGQLCNLVATAMRETRNRVRFYAEQYPFVTIPSAKECAFGTWPWDTKGFVCSAG